MNFVSAYKLPEEIADDSLWLLINGRKIMVLSEDEKIVIPRYTTIKTLNVTPENIQFMGTYDGVPCYTGELPNRKGLSETFAPYPPLALVGKLDDGLVRMAGLAGQLVNWSKSHRVCGKCGNPTEDKGDERAKICRDCGQVYFPRLSPAIIVAVTRDDKILLAHSHRFPADFYSVLAGFVEPGENLEDCVSREVREEVGIELKNIKYFGSQPWPFPDSLMIAFTAEYAGGRIVVDKTEIDDADWFAREDIPRIPPSISIARKLIDWFQQGKQGPEANPPI